MELLGFPPEELQGRVLIDVVPLEDLSRIREGFEEMDKERGSVQGADHQSLGGADSCRAFRGSQGRGIFIMLRDLRERVESRGV